ncbi:EKC/KEOPS complex subunit GON7 isoform X1 [Eublepharis macularius]|uniref:EKC/KEOPS complex subunit GON7 isoform X1 n=1 Tax=Eublepharis macularius TaxID=481883 RepID=A0AA97IYP4_EUBMA|nr:EKC/KEOPS complex subunit GON7 isoform X1 [Eublepharis macularius]
MELRAELTSRDGVKSPLRVSCQPQGNLRGLLNGLVRLREQVSALLDPLVQQESSGAAAAIGDQSRAGGEGERDEEDIDEEDEDEEENHINAKARPDGPPLKRTKTHS